MSQAALAVVVFLSQLLFAELPHNGMSLTADEESEESVEGAEVEEGEDAAEGEEVEESVEEDGEKAQLLTWQEVDTSTPSEQPLMSKCGEIITVHVKEGGSSQVQLLCDDSLPSGNGSSQTASAPAGEP